MSAKIITRNASFTISSHPHRIILIPNGLKCIPATNLPKDSKIKYWLDELPPEWKSDKSDGLIESHFRNYGIGLTDAEVQT